MSADSSDTIATARGLVTVSTRPGLRRHARSRADAHRSFLASQWPELAAAAYEGYRRHGAGAVVLWRDVAPRRFRPRAFEPERLFYTTQIHTLPGTTEADFDGWEARQLETYDPKSEGLVVVVEGGSLIGYRVRGTPSPPLALRAANAQRN